MLGTFLLLSQYLGQPPPLQPYEVASPSGEWTLRVEPQDPRGAGPMCARLARAGKARWWEEFPWTFERAGVSDDGASVGYSNEAGRLRVVVLDPAGSVRAIHEVEQTGRGPHTWPAYPKASGEVLLHPRADLALVRVEPVDPVGHPLPPLWWGLLLSSGERVPDVRPDPPHRVLEGGGWLSEREDRTVGDTGLTLTHWMYADFRLRGCPWLRQGGVFALHDLRGEVVWKIELLDDYTPLAYRDADRLWREVERRDVIGSVGPGERFLLHHVREEVAVEYGLEEERSAPGGWAVRELSRAHWDVGGGEPPGPPGKPRPIELILEAEAQLDSRSVEDEPAEPVYGRIDALGRVLVQDGATHAVHVFDAEGHRITVCHLAPAERPTQWLAPFGGEHDGSIWAWTKRGRAWFDSTGTRRRGWRTPGRSTRCLDEMQLRPDGTWFDAVAGRGFLPDGRRAIVERPDASCGHARLHLFTASGVPLRTIPFPVEADPPRQLYGSNQVSFGARWVVFGSSGPRWMLVRLEDGSAFRFDPGLDEPRDWRVGQTPDGGTLLLLDARGRRLLRYELP